jgi:hypothetical protein
VCDHQAVSHYTPDDIALGIIAEGQRRGVTQKGIQIAISTGLVESNLTMYANHADPESLTYPHDAIGSDANSVGVFQQRDPWWGNCYERMHVPDSSGLFFDSLVDQRIGGDDYNTNATTPGGWAQMVQQSAYPDRYDERYPEACEIYDRLVGQTTGGAPLVGEKVLAYDHSIVPQETGYWCGPASAQVCLNIRGIYVPESQLAEECGTDQGGTDYVALIERCLDPRLPEANYTSVDAPHDPPTADEKDRLWDGILRSINSGYGIVMNWVAPPANYPVGIKGSQSPSYGGGTIYHYVTCAGYDDNPAQRAVWIADSGFQPFGYWMSFDQCATLIPPKAACYANLPHPTSEAPVPDYVRLDYEQKCGPIDPATGYGTGWPQLGVNEQGQNLYLVDALSDILHLLEQGKSSVHWRAEYAAPKTPLDYAKLDYEQNAGPVGEDGYGHGWPQLGGRSITDAVAHIKNTLAGGEPPFPPNPGGGGSGRLAILTFAGTWAAPGVGFPSDVAQACADVADEVPVQAPWSFGKPVSYAESVRIGVDWAVDWTLTHADRPVILGGYSQGGEAAARVRMEFEPGGRLAQLHPNYVAGYVFGNPSRHLEKTFHGGPPTDGEGIAQFRLPLLGDEWCELVDTYDMYAGVPATLTGEIMRDVYTLCTELELGGGFEETFVANCLALLGNLDGDAYDDVKRGMYRHGIDIEEAQLLPEAVINPLTDRLISVKGIAAAIQACVLGIQFICWQPPTAPHIEYGIREVFPGQTYVQLAIQHVHHWAAVRV